MCGFKSSTSVTLDLLFSFLNGVVFCGAVKQSGVKKVKQQEPKGDEQVNPCVSFSAHGHGYDGRG